MNDLEFKKKYFKNSLNDKTRFYNMSVMTLIIHMEYFVTFLLSDWVFKFKEIKLGGVFSRK